MIPLLDLKQVNALMQADIDGALLRVGSSGRYIVAEEVERFESEWARYCQVPYCIATGNALDALRIILMSLGIGPGDEVIVPSNTYIATWLAVTHVGATPVPVEPDIHTFNMNPSLVPAAITRRTKAILGVHLYGRCFDPALATVALRHNLWLLEDAAQAHGAMQPNGTKAGSIGEAAAFSFYPSKNLGALGDAGCITTHNPEIYETARRLRNYGGVGRLDHTMIGINSRMDELQAAVLLAKLPYLDEMNNARRARAYWYDNHIMGVLTPLTLNKHAVGHHVYHQYVCRHSKRDKLVGLAHDRGLELHVHYPTPPHLEGAYAHMCKPRGRYPIAEALGDSVFSLPIGFNVSLPAVRSALQLALREIE